ncbi:hypothetical protein KM043_004214 [Ampulex compressa]|nr:hypothetical protein KM043_004214 [Ampulex compressa]
MDKAEEASEYTGIWRWGATRGARRSAEEEEEEPRSRAGEKRERGSVGAEARKRESLLTSSFREEKMVKFGKPEATWKAGEEENSYGRGEEKFQERYERPEAPEEEAEATLGYRKSESSAEPAIVTSSKAALDTSPATLQIAVNTETRDRSTVTLHNIIVTRCRSYRHPLFLFHNRRAGDQGRGRRGGYQSRSVDRSLEETASVPPLIISGARIHILRKSRGEEHGVLGLPADTFFLAEQTSGLGGRRRDTIGRVSRNNLGAKPSEQIRGGNPERPSVISGTPDSPLDFLPIDRIITLGEFFIEPGGAEACPRLSSLPLSYGKAWPAFGDDA